MRMYEYRAKEVFARYSIPIPRGIVCRTPDEAADACLQVGPDVALKAQVLSGGRGKAGGIKFAHGTDETRDAAKALLGSQVVSLPVTKILVEERLSIAQELYLGVMTDTRHHRACPIIMASRKGGMEIEDLVRGDPGLLCRCQVDPRYGLIDYQALGLLVEAGIPRDLRRAVLPIIRGLYRAYWEMDAEMAEINPLVVTTSGLLLAADARLSIDNNSLFRHPEVEKVYTNDFEERAAAEGFSYAHLDGNIGTMTNGAGLGMATMDAVKIAGGQPANFLDPGGAFVEPKGMMTALEFLQGNPKVNVILINVFGGGIRCDLTAASLVEALDTMPACQVPIVVCLRGRSEEIGLDTLARKAHNRVEVFPNMEEAVQRAVELGRRQTGL